MSSVKNTELYDTLNISVDATPQEIKKAYRLAALKFHPDKNNHSEDSKRKFQEICKAYEILGDAKKKLLYDRYGTVDESVIQEQQQEGVYYGSSGMSAGDLFSQFFGGGSTTSASSFFNDDTMFFTGKKNSQRRVSRGPDIKHNLRCSLEELYHGKKSKLRLDRTRLCKTCKGNGGTSSSACRACNGQGFYTQTRRHGPMVQTWSTTCQDCGGSGTFVRRKNVCAECKGQGCIKERKIFEIEVQPGMHHGQEIVLPEEADEIVYTTYGKEQVNPGDVIIIVQQVKHPLFQIHNDTDLVMNDCHVDLKTSLCGGEVLIENHPCGSALKIDVLPGEILKPGCVKCVESMGMPHPQSQGFGNLYIRFQVDFPDKLQLETINKVSELLGKDENCLSLQKKVELPEGTPVEEHVLSNFVPEFDHEKSRKRSYSASNAANKNRKKHRSDGIADSDQEELQEGENCTVH